MVSTFVDRERELEILKKEWKKQNAFVVIHGRRRVGKTRLIEEFLKGKRGISYTAEDVSKAIQINEFKQASASFLNDDFLRSQEIKNWHSLFSYLEKILDRNERFYIWIDEFSHIIKNS